MTAEQIRNMIRQGTKVQSDYKKKMESWSDWQIHEWWSQHKDWAWERVEEVQKETPMKNLNVLIHELTVITAYVNALPVECDGASRLVHMALVRAGVEHKCMFGRVFYPFNGFEPYAPHFWISVSPLIIDYRLRMWVGEKWGVINVPHGVFNSQETKIAYSGEPVYFTWRECEILEASIKQDILYPNLVDQIEAKLLDYQARHR